jgi:hypothetical protein
MDSMRHLSTSLPGSRRRNDQTQQLLADFKAAALSVTNLYKTAAGENTRARETGYQDALDDLLSFLDKENLGLGDGEGWRVRQWATERLDDKEDEEGARDDLAGTRSSSPEVLRKPQMAALSSELVEESEPRPASEPPQQPPQQQASRAPQALPSLEDFAFRSTQPYPTNHDRETNNTMELDQSSSSTPSSTSTVRITPKPSRSRHNNHNRNRENRANAATLNFNLGNGAGSKRKMPYPDFFDISGLNFEGQNRDGKDGNGGRGGKRGRHV